jgi:hypothetical protein
MHRIADDANYDRQANFVDVPEFGGVLAFEIVAGRDWWFKSAQRVGFTKVWEDETITGSYR